MDFPLTLIDLAGTVALLLWGVRMVQTGVQRAFGPRLRQVLGTALRNRFAACAAGLGVTAILQSSTATGLMTASFAAGGLVDLVPALAVMLGANIGTTLIVQLLSFNVAGLSPALFLIGVLMFRRGGAARTRDLGRTAIGLGLMLMALHQLLELVSPYEDVPSMRLLLGAVSTEPLLDVLLGAVVTWAAHSSVAVVLLVMSLAAKGAVPPYAAFALVLGANLGTALNPVLEGEGGDSPASRRLPYGNLLNRALGCAVALAVLPAVSRFMVQFDPDTARAVADFHTLFNVVLAVVFFPLLGPYAALLRRMFPAKVNQADPSRPLYLDASAQEVPALAVGAAAREALRLADVLDAMLVSARDAFVGADRRQIAEARRMDDTLDRLNTAIKAYLGGLDAGAMDESDHLRVEEILIFAHNLEHAGDIVEKNLMGAAAKRVKRGLTLSEAELTQIGDLLGRLINNVHAAASVFMTDDVRAARMLAVEKEAFRDIEDAATQAHFDRLRAGSVQRPADAGALQLDVLRDLKQVNAHLVAAAAYPVLKSHGGLLASRLRVEEED
ncbi:MAG TPA: Na/Pi cotransporter family protein [Rhodopila sp.]|jgi:phosphate:Na+ symporter|nr:Na/Pi cotransporter family protein [Rhodopila sp.]